MTHYHFVTGQLESDPSKVLFAAVPGLNLDQMARLKTLLVDTKALEHTMNPSVPDGKEFVVWPFVPSITAVQTAAKIQDYAERVIMDEPDHTIDRDLPLLTMTQDSGVINQLIEQMSSNEAP